MNKKYIPYLRESLYKLRKELYNESDLSKRYWIKKNMQTTTALLQQIDEFCSDKPAKCMQIVDSENKGFANSCIEARWCPVIIL